MGGAGALGCAVSPQHQHSTPDCRPCHTTQHTTLPTHTYARPCSDTDQACAMDGTSTSKQQQQQEHHAPLKVASDHTIAEAAGRPMMLQRNDTLCIDKVGFWEGCVLHMSVLEEACAEGGDSHPRVDVRGSARLAGKQAQGVRALTLQSKASNPSHSSSCRPCPPACPARSWGRCGGQRTCTCSAPTTTSMPCPRGTCPSTAYPQRSRSKASQTCGSWTQTQGERAGGEGEIAAEQ